MTKIAIKKAITHEQMERLHDMTDTNFEELSDDDRSLLDALVNDYTFAVYRDKLIDVELVNNEGVEPFSFQVAASHSDRLH